MECSPPGVRPVSGTEVEPVSVETASGPGACPSVGQDRVDRPCNVVASASRPADSSTQFVTEQEVRLSRVLKLHVPVIVRLAERRIPVKHIMQWSTGSIIEFDKPADAELDLMINNKCIGFGRAVKVGENFGLRVTRIQSIRGMIKAFAGR